MTAKQTRSEYTVSINGIEHTVLLTEDEAKAAGATAKVAETKAAHPANKSRSVKDK